MTDPIRVTLEIGPKGKKVVAVAPDWPGLERGAKTGEAAIERLHSYLPRYAQVAKLAGMDAEFDDHHRTSTWSSSIQARAQPTSGASRSRFRASTSKAMSGDELERELTLMQACWAFFDDVRWRVSAELRKGPRGGGRDRDRIVRHIFANEQDWAKGLGVLTPDDATADGRGAESASRCLLPCNPGLPLTG